MQNLELSLLIPTFNEADVIESALKAISEEFTVEQNKKIEILVVDDGSDNLPEVVEKITPNFDFAKIQVLRNDPPLGKGKSLALGFEKARAPIAGFLDVDLSTPPSYIKQAVKSIATDSTDIFIGSRKVAGAHVDREQFFLKDILGKTLSIVANGIIFSGMRSYADTQCGFKFFKTPLAKTLFHNLMANDGLGDLEVLIRANLLNLRVQECGVVWTDLRESKRSLRRILWGEIKGITKILLRYKLCPTTQRMSLKKLLEENKTQKTGALP